MTGFLGEFEATLDAKGRFLLPAGLKKQLPEGEGNLFVINRGFEQCLALYPIKSWEPLFAEINKLNEFDPKARQFRRHFLNVETNVEPDCDGRFIVQTVVSTISSLTHSLRMISAILQKM